MKKLQLLIAFCCLVFLSSCETDDNGNNDQNGQKTLQISTEQTEILAGEMVLLSANVDFQQLAYDGQFGFQNVQLGRTDNHSQLAFIAPALPSGAYDLSIMVNDTEVKLTFGLYTDENLPTTEVISDFQQQNRDNVQFLTEMAENSPHLTTAEVTEINKLIQEFDLILQEMTDNDQKNLAHFIHANNLTLNDFEKIDLVDSFAKNGDVVYPSDQKSRIGKLIADRGIRIIVASTVFALSAKVPSPDLWTKGTAVASALWLVCEHQYVQDKIQEILNLEGIFTRFDQLLQKRELELTHDIPLPLDIRNQYRSLQISDENANSGFLSALVGHILSIYKAWNEFTNTIERIRSWFAGQAPDLQEKDPGFTQKTKSYKGNPRYYRIENVSNGVELALVRNDENLSLLAKAAETQNFSFDLVFENPDMELEIREQVTATVTVEEGCGISTFTDPRDNQTYAVVQIGEQCWLGENLNYVTPTSACFDFGGDDCNTFGRLYDWQTANTVCPQGTHLASSAEWETMIEYLGGASVAGGKLKSLQLWESPNTGASNASGFSALPGGNWTTFPPPNGSFGNLLSMGYWWTSDQKNMVLRADDAGISSASPNLNFKFSCRCILD